MPLLPSTQPSGSMGRRSSAFVAELVLGASERGACQPAIHYCAVPVNGHRRIGNRPSAHQNEQQAGGRAGKGSVALAMTWLNCQTACVVPDHPLAAVTKPVIGGVYVQSSAGG